MTSGASRDTNARLVQMHENVLPVDVLERDVRRVWQTLRTICCAVETRVGNVREDLVFKTIAKLLDRSVIVVVACELACGPEADDVRDCGRAGATPLLLRAADNERRQRHAFANV